MAMMDQRLIPFIEMLIELGMDWLAFELIEGVRRGQEPIEKEDALALARQKARTGSAEKFARNPGDSVVEDPLVGDNQLEWAARSVSERLEATLAEISASLCALDEMVASDREGQAKIAEHSAVLVLIDEEQDREVSRTQVEEAQGQLDGLRQSLETWLVSTQSDIDQ